MSTTNAVSPRNPSPCARRHWGIGLLISFSVLAGMVFFTGIRWGLPSRRVDAYLFGSHPVWTGRDILDRLGTAPAEPGEADGATSSQPGGEPVCLNATDAQRAHIVRRYRLLSYQPDEMITFLVLSEMAQRRDLDPRLYQYGGLWIYPVGGLLRAASLAGLVELKADQAYYLDHSEAFGRFYVVARAYSAAWGVVGVWVVWLLTLRLTGGHRWAAVIACLGYLFMPVVVNMGHEAKPHLPGAVLMLWAAWGGMKFLDSGRGRWAILCGMLCGAAQGMVLSALPIFSVLVALLLLRPRRWRWMVWAGVAGGLVYAITNPYVVINKVWHPEILRTSLGYSTAMYKVGWHGEGFPNALRLIREGATLGMLVLGMASAAWAACRWFSARRPEAMLPHGWLLALPALLSFAQFTALAANKPGEYARFALFLDVTLAIATAVLLGRLGNKRMIPLAAIVLLPAALVGGAYVRGFVRDCGGWTSRLAAVGQVATLPPGPILIDAKPAPYVFPPINVFDRPLLLRPGGSPLIADVRVRESWLTPISWADTSFEVAGNKGSGSADLSR